MSGLRHGFVAGALAGLWLAVGDYGALWLWLPVPSERALLLLRLLGSIVPIGALCGALAGSIGTLVLRALPSRGGSRDALWPLPFVALAIAPSLWLAAKLCTGGMMARLAQQWPLQLALSVLLPCALYGSLFLGLRAGRFLLREPRRQLIGVASLLTLATLLGKANQLVLPNLYDYLHALLALLTWASAALGIALLLRVPRLADVSAAITETRWVATGAVLLLAGGLLNAFTLDQNLNVRVAMFDARSPTSRALLANADPLLRRLEPPRAPRPTAQPARDRVDASGLPSTPGAHVLLVTIDALRASHLGAYGYGRPVSPKLDALASNALLFERPYAQAPHSSYSLSSLHTSEYVHELVELGRPLPTATLASAFEAHGYHTAAFFTDGIFHTEGEKLRALRDSVFGFALFDQTNRAAEQQTDRVLAEVDRIKQRGEPSSLIWVHYFDVHEPYQQTTFGKSDLDRYDSEILHVDRELDRLLVEMRKRLTRPVIVAISADHGEEFRDHGGVYHGSTLYDEQVRVPLIVQIPSYAPAHIAAPVEVIDIAPTLLGAVGAAVPTSMRGRDLRTLSRDDPSQVGDHPVFSAVLTKRMGLVWPYKLIADLRFGLFELYNLERDPLERRNLASTEPERLAELRNVVYGWLDALERGGARVAQRSEDDQASSWQRALRLGRLGDRRAVEPAAALLLDRSAPTPLRCEAGQVLAKLGDPRSVPALLNGLTTEPAAVAAEAAVALGRMYDSRSRDSLLRLMHVEDPYLRARAAISLARLRDGAAVPALIEALWVAPTQYEREEAVRWLGRLRDPSAVEPLLSLLPEFRLRYLIAVALGQLGDVRAYDALVGALEWESRTNIRDAIAHGLGLLGDARAIPVLVKLLDREPGLRNTAESLVRLGAHELGELGGLDVGPHTLGLAGFAGCEAGPLRHDWDYLGRTHCTTRRRRAQLDLPLPAARTSWVGARLVMRAKRSDQPEAVACALTLRGIPLGSMSVDGEYREQRWDLPPELLQEARLPLVLECADARARMEVDHVLVVPRTEATASLASEPAKASHDAHSVQ